MRVKEVNEISNRAHRLNKNDVLYACVLVSFDQDKKNFKGILPVNWITLFSVWRWLKLLYWFTGVQYFRAIIHVITIRFTMFFDGQPLQHYHRPFEWMIERTNNAQPKYEAQSVIFYVHLTNRTQHWIFITWNTPNVDFRREPNVNGHTTQTTPLHHEQKRAREWRKTDKFYFVNICSEQRARQCNTSITHGATKPSNHWFPFHVCFMPKHWA